MHCMLMDLLHGFEVLSTTEETLFNSNNYLVHFDNFIAIVIHKIFIFASRLFSKLLF